MNLAALDSELDRLEEALIEAKTMKEWDETIRRYNALKLDRCRITGESITAISVNVESKQLINTRNHG